MSRMDFPDYHPRSGQHRPGQPRYVNVQFEPEAPPRRRGLDKRILGGVAGAVALGLVGGFLMRPTTDDQQPARTVATRKAEVPAESKGLDIVVDKRPPPPVEAVTPPSPAGGYTAPLEGYTPQPVQRVEAPQPAPRTPPVQASRPAPVVVSRPAPAATPVSRPAPAERSTDGSVLRPYSDVLRERGARTVAVNTRPSFNCRYARTVSERMVCADPNLAASDRRLNRAYNQAIASGVSERALRRQQDIWLSAREDAARSGPGEVAQVYEARIAELQDMAER